MNKKPWDDTDFKNFWDANEHLFEDVHTSDASMMYSLITQPLKDRENKLVEALKFYADHNNWRDNDILGTTSSIDGSDEQFGNDFGQSKHLTIGGKRAREVLKELGVEL